MTTLRRLAALAVVAAAAVLLFAPQPVAWQAGWRAKLLDFGHVPLFAALAVALRVGLRWRLRWCLLVAVAAAGLVEVVQPFAGRTAGWGDFAHGVLGALAGAAVVRAVGCRLPGAAGWLALAAGLVAWPVAEVAPHLVDAVEANRAFPVLAEFETDRELLRWEWHQAELTRVPDPGWPGGRVGRLDLFPGREPYPGASLRPVVGDFRGHRRLCCAIRVDGDPLGLVISVRSATADPRRTTHAQVGRTYPEGDHKVCLDLADLAAAGRPDPLDLSDVRHVQFFTVRPATPRTVFISRVWLEP